MYVYEKFCHIYIRYSMYLHIDNRPYTGHHEEDYQTSHEYMSDEDQELNGRSTNMVRNYDHFILHYIHMPCSKFLNVD